MPQPSHELATIMLSAGALAAIVIGFILLFLFLTRQPDLVFPTEVTHLPKEIYMPFVKALSQDQKDVLMQAINEHAHAQAALGAVMAMRDNAPEPIFKVVQENANRKMAALQQVIDGMTHEAAPNHGDLSASLAS